MSERAVLILAGGRGERFWPWSTPARPKQLLPLASGGRTLLAATVERATKVVSLNRIYVMTAESLVEAVRQECRGTTVLGEPMPRNTAPAIAAASVLMPGAFAVMPADHAIEDLEAFRVDLERAFSVAERDDVLVTFGIRPTGPDTNFGYIQRGASLGDRLHRVARFKEKPDLTLAKQWAADGQHLWNSGIFVWHRSVFMDALEKGRPEVARAFRGLSSGGESGFTDKLREIFPKVESISVDYAVLEQATNAVVIEASFDWDDLGSWGAWARRQPRDERGNVRYGDTEVRECDRCVVVGEGGTAAAIGLQDTVVVHANGATLSCRLDQSEQVRKVSEAMRTRSAS